MAAKAACRANFRQGTVVAAIPEDRVFTNAEVHERVAKFSESAVHAGHLAVKVLKVFWLVCVQLAIFLRCDVRTVRRTKPNYGEEWIVRLDLFGHPL